jgi:hypothetical protein
LDTPIVRFLPRAIGNKSVTFPRSPAERLALSFGDTTLRGENPADQTLIANRMTPFKLISPVACRQRVASEMEKFQNFSPEAKALPDPLTDSPSTHAATVGVKFTSNSSGVTFTSQAFFPGRNKPKTKIEVIPTGLADGNSCDFQFLAALSEAKYGKRRGEAR